MVPPHLPHSHWEVFLSAGTQRHHNTTSATKVDDVAVVLAVGTDTGRDRNMSVLSSCSLQLFQIFSEVMIVAQV